MKLIYSCNSCPDVFFGWAPSQKDSDYAYNLYACDTCGRVMREDVCGDTGHIWLGLTGVESNEEENTPNKAGS
jgi:hypothetical protein